MQLRTLLTLLLAFAASGAWAQDASGVWAFDFINPDDNETVDSGFLVIAPSGEDGRMTLDDAGPRRHAYRHDAHGLGRQRSPTWAPSR